MAGLTASRFHAIRRAVLREIAPDFAECQGCCIRQTRHGQQQCLEFGAPRRAAGWAVTLGVHFARVPPFVGIPPWAAFHDRHPGELRATKCCFQQVWRGADGGQFFPCGETEEEAAERLRTELRGCRSVLDAFDSRWRDGSPLLEAVPPERLRTVVENLSALANPAATEGELQLAHQNDLHELMPGWFPQVQPLALLLAYLSRSSDRPELVPQYVALANADAPGFWTTPLLAELSEALLRK